ncbi:unnamed protein product [Schistocephalus solidus]|uniref:Vacuolar protein sorting-associated protein 51 homolog n=1 Tax=Schistocephalus solidus TaxID=70667 RepID=A0A183TF66_SCHSO|nr:unnamed protein product [Schistocephalus solidus]
MVTQYFTSECGFNFAIEDLFLQIVSIYYRGAYRSNSNAEGKPEILRISGVALQHVFAGASDHERNNLTEQLKRDFSTIFSAADEMVTQLLSSRKPTESTEIDEMNYFLPGVCNMFDVVMDPDASEASKTPKINSLSLLEPPCFVISETGLQLLHTIEGAFQDASGATDDRDPCITDCESADDIAVLTRSFAEMQRTLSELCLNFAKVDDSNLILYFEYSR